MKHTHFNKDIKDYKKIKKVCKYIKRYLYSLYLPFEIYGCCNSPSIYFQFKCFNLKDKIIRVSNHSSKHKDPNIFSIIISNDIDSNWLESQINNISNWLER